MAPKDQDLFDMTYVLDSIDTFTESVEAHFENVAHSLQEAFRQSSWLPDSVKPRPPPPSCHVPSVHVPVGYIEALRHWISEHRAVTGAVVAFTGTWALIVWRQRHIARSKRKAKRAKSGARTEVVIVYGSPHSPLTRSISLDLERKGFIVYLPVRTLSEEQVIQGYSRQDIRPLSLDITSPSSIEQTLRKLSASLRASHHAIPNTKAHILQLAAFIFVPSSTNYSPTAIASLTPTIWSDVFASHLLAPYTTINAFLPLLTSHNSTLLFLTPAITSSHLFPPHHVADAFVQSGMTAYISTLRHEVSPSNLRIAEIKLGHLDLGASANSSTGLDIQDLQIATLDPTNHSSPSRADLTRSRLSAKDPATSSRRHPKSQGTSLKHLHNNIFDIIASPSVSSLNRERTLSFYPFGSLSPSHPRTTFVGQGARFYDLVGRWAPRGLIGAMMAGRASKDNTEVRAEVKREVKPETSAGPPEDSSIGKLSGESDQDMPSNLSDDIGTSSNEEDIHDNKSDSRTGTWRWEDMGDGETAG